MMKASMNGKRLTVTSGESEKEMRRKNSKEDERNKRFSCLPFFFLLSCFPLSPSMTLTLAHRFFFVVLTVLS